MPQFMTRLDVQKSQLPELLRRGHEDIGILPADLQSQWTTEATNACERARRNGVDSLIAEFTAPFRDNILVPRYELAFIPQWYDNPATQPLYLARWWITSYTAGVYFIYDNQNQLKYIGRSCGGELGQRVWSGAHKLYRTVVDIVLFDRNYCHFALAFEALAVSRLKPEHNDEFKTLEIPVQSLGR